MKHENSGNTLIGMLVAVSIVSILIHGAVISSRRLLAYRALRAELQRLDAYFASVERVRSALDQTIALQRSGERTLTPLHANGFLRPLELSEAVRISQLAFGETPFGAETICFYAEGAASAGRLTLESSSGATCSLIQSVLGLRRSECN